jgi:hypothetical protein
MPNSATPAVTSASPTNSFRHRACPNCQSLAHARRLEHRQAELLPEVEPGHSQRQALYASNRLSRDTGACIPSVTVCTRTPVSACDQRERRNVVPGIPRRGSCTRNASPNTNCYEKMKGGIRITQPKSEKRCRSSVPPLAMVFPGIVVITERDSYYPAVACAALIAASRSFLASAFLWS